jgi:hypothetical protein
VDVHHGDEAEDQEWWQKPKIAALPPFLTRQMSNWFHDTPIDDATGAARYGSFIGESFGLLVVSYR